MPDVWTTNPPKLRNMLQEAGVSCGHPSRVLHPRDPEWTCRVDSDGVLRDLYIHDFRELYRDPLIAVPAVFALVFGILLGVYWGKRFWRQAGQSGG